MGSPSPPETPVKGGNPFENPMVSEHSERGARRLTPWPPLSWGEGEEKRLFRGTPPETPVKGVAPFENPVGRRDERKGGSLRAPLAERERGQERVSGGHPLNPAGQRALTISIS